MEGLAPHCGIKGDDNSTRGRMCKLSQIIQSAGQCIKTLREQSFQVHGCKLFNKMPAEIRNMKNCGINEFKEKLDIFLSPIPDQPVIGHLTPTTCNPVTLHPSNSILDWAGT